MTGLEAISISGLAMGMGIVCRDGRLFFFFFFFQFIIDLFFWDAKEKRGGG